MPGEGHGIARVRDDGSAPLRERDDRLCYLAPGFGTPPLGLCRHTAVLADNGKCRGRLYSQCPNRGRGWVDERQEFIAVWAQESSGILGVAGDDPTDTTVSSAERREYPSSGVENPCALMCVRIENLPAPTERL